MKRFAIVTAFLALAFPALAQQPLEEKIDVNAVLLDVIVTDAKGNQILGLGKDDFIVKENGVVQTVESADYLTNRRLLDAREENAPFKVEHVNEDRYFIFFFDKPSDPGALFDQVTLARESVRNFIKNDMKDTDRIAIVGHDNRLKIYSDFTSDKEQLGRALNDAARFGPGVTAAPAGSGASILRAMSSKDLVNRTGTVYRAIEALADAVRPIRARKNLVLFSPGIADLHETERGGMLVQRSPDLDPMLEALNGANVTVYGVQLQRDVDTTPLFHQRLSEMSESTGGRYFRFNTSFSPAIKQIENTNAGYYLLSYTSRHRRGDKGFQKVDVSVKNPEFRVTARSGYQFGS
jgi:VWFA-related protein